jgi:ATP-dependent RNA helicase RhlE
MDLVEQKVLSLSTLQCLVLDEADRMLDMGFIPAVRKIVKGMPRQRQTLMFSATFSKEILKLTAEFLNDPMSIQVAADNAAAESVEQQVYHLAKSQKPKLLQSLIQSGQWEQVLVFTRTKHGADRLCKRLLKQKISSVAIHGGKTQPQRVKALQRFKDREVRVMVATDIAARGIDIKALPHVVNYEVPNVAEDYVHRIGRTGRAGAEGHAVSLVCAEEKAFLGRIERLMGQKMEVLSTASFDLPEATEHPPQKARPTANAQKKPKPKAQGSSFGRRKPSAKMASELPKSKRQPKTSMAAKPRQRTKVNPAKAAGLGS